jgi:hypothetical protein
LSIGTAASIILMGFALFVLGAFAKSDDVPDANPRALNSLGLLETVRLMDGTPLQLHLASTHPADRIGLRDAAAAVEVRVVGDRLVYVEPTTPRYPQVAYMADGMDAGRPV